jgi:FkbM family methyltransferase
LGALHFGLDPRLLEALRRQLPLRIFFETGTFQAGTTTAVAPLFDRIYTVELSPVLYDGAKQKLGRLKHVEVILGSSPDVLRARGPELSSSSVLYWLDAHWCGGPTSGTANECPLLDELAAIGTLNDSSVVLIDDARFFLGPPPAPHKAAHWPGVLEIEAALRRISSQHGLWIINDVIIYAPQRIADDVVAFGRAHGTDLAALARAARRGAQASAAKPPQAAAAKAIDGGHGLDADFNSVLLGQERSERIFAFHANRLGITRLLDVGSNAGQFAAALRRFGFEGVIYSVEPQTSAHMELRQNAQDDVRWIPLSRQAAGRHRGRLDLNLSQNSWSSSFLPVHENHLRAAPEARMVGQERVFVTKTADLLREPLMRKIDALKIDVQGYELEVLEGLRSCMDGIRLILLEMSSVECYVGAPELFALDRLLVEEWGFVRISLEPSYYDGAGVAQQFDGIYARAPAPDAVTPADEPYAFGATVTSMHGVPSRTDPSGEELGGEWVDLCVESWLQLSDSIISVSEAAPPDPRVRWIRMDERPSVADLFAAMPLKEGEHTILCNADIVVAHDLKRLAARFDPATVYLAHRMEVEFNAANPQLLDSKAIYGLGFDLFLLPPEFVRFVRDSGVLPPEFRVGQPWWDYLVPLAALAGGFPVKRLPRNQSLALHYEHPTRFERDTWLKLGETFLSAVAALKSEFPSRGCDLLDEIAALPGPLRTRLDTAAGIVCSRLP